MAPNQMIKLSNNIAKMASSGDDTDESTELESSESSPTTSVFTEDEEAESELSHVVHGFPWGDLPTGTIVDVGGSHGHASFAIARQFPLVSSVVQDLQPIISTAENSIPVDLTTRVKFMAHDLLAAQQPVVGADVYFFRGVFHNWSDQHAVEILRNQIPALKHGARIVVHDGAVAPVKGGEEVSRIDMPPLSIDRTMAEMQNSHVREMDDWAKLFADADSRFEFQGGQQPPASNFWLVVAEWKGGESDVMT
ncbi:O-methyltransferase-domain-containing protein [Nemania sp. FL0916]|nr:O-methyltransferase-domain-containing protein [Nemania sp. FL0916]